MRDVVSPGERQPERGNSVCAVIVTYEPELETLCEVIRRVSNQVDSVVVADNSERADVAGSVGQQVGDIVAVLAMGGNKGIACAHNRGIGYARERGATHVLLMDQDSLAEPGMVENLMAAITRMGAAGGRVAAVGARYNETGSGRVSAFVRFGWFKFKQIPCPKAVQGAVVRADFLISSGSLIPIQVLTDVGDMDEDLFIDHVDTEWFLRARHKGYSAYGVCDALMAHSLGEGGIPVWLGRWRNLPKHNPVRYYYIVRNSVLLYKRRYAPLRWIAGDLLRLAVIVVFYTVLQAPRWTRLKMIGRGLVDGLAGKVGQYTLQG